MIKIKVKKIICTALASGVLMGVTPALNIAATTNEVIESSNLTEEQREELNYAIEEMKIAIDLVDNADFTDGTSYERMVAFATASLDRVRGLEINNEHVEWIEESGDEVRDLTYSINRVLHAIKNVEIVFSEERNDTVESKENVINTLNLVLTQEMEAGALNDATLRSAVNILHAYNSKIDSSSEVEKVGLSEEQREELNYAIEEMKIAIDLVDNADFTDGTSYERMVAFATASLDRVRGLEINNEHVEWIEESGDEVRDLTYSINRVLHAIKNVEIVFSEERNDTVESKENVINTLNLVLTQEMEAGALNDATLRSAVNILHAYNSKIDSSSEVEKVGLSEEQREELNYAIEEMKIAIDLVDNADFTDGTSYERMVAFATASLDRVRGLEINNEHVEWIEESGDEVRDLTYSINRVLHAIKNVEIVFSEERNDTVESKENVINTLNLVLTQEMEAGALNDATLRSAINILHSYANRI